MDWIKKYSDAEIERRQEQYIKEALQMAKRAVKDENAATEAQPEEKMYFSQETAVEIDVINETFSESENTDEVFSEESEQDEELTRFLDCDEHDEDEDSYIEVKNSLERLIDRIADEKSSEEKSLCNCPTCRKKRMGK